MPIKVLYLIDKMVRAGAQRHLRQLISGLDRGGFKPVICCLLEKGPVGEELEAEGVRVESLGLRNIMGRRFPAAVRGVADLIRREEAQLLHAYLFSANVVAPWAGRFRRIPVITSRRDTGFWKTGRHVLANRIGNLLTDRITVNSLEVLEYVLSREKAPPGKVVLVHNGIDLEEYPPVPSRGIRPGERIVLGCLGNVRPVKGYEYLLQALEDLRNRGVDCEARIGGRLIDQEYHRRLEVMAERSALHDRVHFLGEIADVPVFLRSLKIFVLPSLAEGFPNALLEALAAGLPVVATDVGGNREVIRDGQDGFLIPPGDSLRLAGALGELISDPSRAALLSREGRRRVEDEFGAERMCRRLENLYRQLAE